MKEGTDPIVVGITAGDINGVGPEVIIKTFADARMLENVIPVVYSSAEGIKAYRKTLGIEEFSFHSISDSADAMPKKVNLVNAYPEKFELTLGQSTKEGGAVALASLETATKDLASNKIDVLVTAPINKMNIQSSTFKFPGHTEYLSAMSHVADSLMFMVADNLRVGIVTGHLPLKDVAAGLTKDKISVKLNLMIDSLARDFGINKPNVAVLGLNPHAGDDGLLGSEEKEIITPVIREFVERGHLVFGPYGADGFFGSGAFKQFDGVLAMYHDQGLTPFKTMAFENGVNFTAGLPIVRTSPDHGTGYDIAGKNLADPSSFREAVRVACDIYLNRQLHKELTENILQPQKRKKDE
jgi:4-hydroxythreonine-4-phosphate dehydrogenase